MHVTSGVLSNPKRRSEEFSRPRRALDHSIVIDHDASNGTLTVLLPFEEPLTPSGWFALPRCHDTKRIFESAHYQRHLGSTINRSTPRSPRHNGTLGSGGTVQASSFASLLENNTQQLCTRITVSNFIINS